jgi:hypothetical protein
MRIVTLTLILLAHGLFVCGQNDTSYKRIKYVLESNLRDSLFVFDDSKGEDYDRDELRYLGQITTNDQRTFKILNSCWYWGRSPRATSKILIFDGQNRYLGVYHLNMAYELPSRLIDGQLIFDSKVDLKKGLPSLLYIACEGESGDTYAFSRE